MTPSNQIPAVCNYGTSAVYSDYPSPEQMRAGVVPLDSLPAAWWNKMWCASNCAINEARDMVGQIITEVNNVLCQAGINPQAACTDQLYQSINKIRQTLATASVPGAVVSSSTASEVAVDPATGRMTVNCLGNAASLSTSASTVVGAINELKSTYDCCFSDTATALSGKAPTSHASSATTYGVGSADNYGHLKISDTYTSVLAVCSGVAASQKALACVYAVAAAAAAGNISLGNTAGCALGTAAAGTATTAARSDHVHPKPSRSDLGLGSAAGCAVKAAVSTATHTDYNNNQGYLPTMNFLSYWNGAYNATGCSNLSYTAVGKLGSAATCAATAFLGASGCAADSAKLGGTAASSYLKTTGCAADSAKLGGRTASQFIRNCNGADLGANAALGTYHTMTQAGPNAAWNHLLNMGWGECAGTDTWASQISVPSQNSMARMSYRCHCNNSTNNSWQAWRELIDDSGSQTINGWLAATCFCGNVRGNVCGTASNATNATNATNASGACYAKCHYYFDSCLRVFTNGSNCTGWGDMILCNFSGAPVRVFYPWPFDWTKTCCNASYLCCALMTTYNNCINSCYYGFNCGTDIRKFLESIEVIPAGFCACFYSGSVARVFCIPTVAYY